jgi:hypothetical protein
MAPLGIFAVVIAAAITAVLGGIGWLLWGYPRGALRGSILGRREQAFVAAAADAFFPAGGPIPVSGAEAGAVPYFDGYLRRSRRTQRFLMRLLFSFTELGPLVFGQRRRRFSRLSLDERLLFLAQASQSRIYFRRVAFISLRALMTMAYLANDDVARTMGMVADLDPFGLRAARAV